jgi:RPA43 OB domain in RNA Pol I
MGKRRSDKNQADDEQRHERKRIKKEKKKKKNKENDSQQLPAAATTSSIDLSEDGVFFRKKLELTISLLPSALSNVYANAEDALRLFLLRYSDGIGGVMLAYENVKVLSENKSRLAGIILNELPHIHYRVSTSALVFNPAPGGKMRGKVTDSSFHSHLSLVVHKYFNASIPADSLREAGFEFDDVQLQWYHQQNVNATALNRDDEIDFICRKLYESGGMISIEGATPVLVTSY